MPVAGEIGKPLKKNHLLKSTKYTHIIPYNPEYSKEYITEYIRKKNFHQFWVIVADMNILLYVFW